ncbi:hypothetical protein Ddye_011423 [Dipteronia dyeriana]|uniref:Uncharacterized protein n=1 Tax=Dipteronia dyeriana TaxID=168575 RepID=A0AAE0CGZ4_9ROSI|nr:hypothetical protein Ddye_011423 [Dipteronia dyeriana]
MTTTSGASSSFLWTSIFWGRGLLESASKLIRPSGELDVDVIMDSLMVEDPNAILSLPVGGTHAQDTLCWHYDQSGNYTVNNGYSIGIRIPLKIERTFIQRSMTKIMQLKQHLQSLKKRSASMSDFVMKLKAVGDALTTVGETEMATEMDSIITIEEEIEEDLVVELIRGFIVNFAQNLDMEHGNVT